MSESGGECYFLNRKELDTGEYELTYQYGVSGVVEKVVVDSAVDAQAWIDALRLGGASRAINGVKLDPCGWLTFNLGKNGFHVVAVEMRLTRSGNLKPTFHKLPTGTGSSPPASQRKKKNQITELHTSQDRINFTREFNEPKKANTAFKNLCSWVVETFPDREGWSRKIKRLVLRNSKRITSVWILKPVKSHSSKSELLCESIDGMNYQDATLWEILEATDPLGSYTCYKEKVKVSKTGMVCIRQDDQN